MNTDLTPLQGRAAFHMERIFRSTGGGLLAHQRFLRLAKSAQLPKMIGEWTEQQCVTGLRLMEAAAREFGMQQFRDVKTGWQLLADNLRRTA